jgi:hypothetical protein
MEIQPQTTKPISDDQELAKVLAGVSQQADAELNFEETPLPQPTAAAAPEEAEERQEAPVAAAPVVAEAPHMPTPSVSGDLGSIKKEAITDLRPLVDKLNLEAEEKFDIYLLILRSTDDTALIAPAYAAARSITDESKRAQALLDIIKEIDYLSSPKQPAL